MTPAVNREGMTFFEWVQAATLGRNDPGDTLPNVGVHNPSLRTQQRRAWKRGEDPTEWAVLLPPKN